MIRLFLLLSLLLSLATPLAQATTLPAGVTRFVQSLNKTAKIREDGLVAMPNGSIYLPVLPQDPTVDLNPTRITRQWLGKDNQPDLVQFDNNLFLIRFNKGSRGKLVMAKLAYPIELKEGLLPQDLKLPGNVVIPGELKILLGGVNYSNRALSDTPDWVDTSVPVYQPGTASNGVVPNQVSHVLPANQLYLADATTQQLQALNLDTGKPISKTDLGCMPSAITPTPGGLLALVTCLNTNQFMVVDPITQQVRSQFATGQRPSAIWVANEADVWVANRFDKFLNVYPLVPVIKQTGDHTDEENTLTVDNQQVALTTPADMLVAGPSPALLLAVDSASGTVHVIDTLTKTVAKTFKTQPALSGVTMLGNQVWTISRSMTTAKAYNLKTGQEEKTLTTGKKPVAIVAGERLYILCAEDHRVDVVDPAAGTVLTTVNLPEDSFPNSLLWNGRQLFAASPSLGQVYVINLDSYRIQTTWSGKATLLSFNVPATVIPLEPISVLATTATPTNPVKPGVTPAKSTLPAIQTAEDLKDKPAPKKGFLGKFGNLFKL